MQTIKTSIRGEKVFEATANQSCGAVSATLPIVQALPESQCDARSEGGQSDVSQVSGTSQGSMSTEQRAEAKTLIKTFVRSMVKGRKLDVVLANGQLKTCYVLLGRKLDALKIKASEKDKQERRVPLASIEEILAGNDLSQSDKVCDIETPLDELSVTLSLSTEESITFRMHDADARDTLVMCLTMFANEAKAKEQEEDE